MLFDGLTVVANPRRLLREPSFRAFVAPIIDGRGAFGEGLDLEAVIMEVSQGAVVVQLIVLPLLYSSRCYCLQQLDSGSLGDVQIAPLAVSAS